MKKKLLTTLMVLAACSTLLFAQVPQQMNYQAVVRDASGNPLPDGSNVTIKFTIHDGSPTGTPVFTETNVAVTNRFGLVTQ
ncbi:MAG TPA: hypothetical protein VG603_15465, partial [Chitinophagales bacterium]|nr:hypothetical protein [Chitinophagales bacterium]